MADWKENLNNFLLLHRNRFSSLILIGSTIYSGKLTKKSDIDLIGVVDNFEQWKDICYNLYSESDKEEFYNNSLELYKKNKVHYFCLKFFFEDREYALDVILKKDLVSIINEFKNLKNQKFQVYKLVKTPQLNSYNFAWGKESFDINKENYQYKNAYILSCPVYVKKKDKYYFGIMLNKLFSGYKVIHNDGRFEEELERLIRETAQILMNKNKSDNIMDLIASLIRFKNFKKEHITELKKKLS